MSKQLEYPTVFQPWAKIDGAVEPHRPETMWEALMSAAPGETPEMSVEELQPLREAIAECVDRLPAEHRFVINGVQSERLSFRQLAARLGCSVGRAHSVHVDGLSMLKAMLLNEPKVREHMGLEPTWDSAVREALTVLENDPHAVYRGRTLDSINYWLGLAVRLHHGEMHLMSIGDCLEAIGTCAITYLDTVGMWDREDEAKLLCSKQHDYGHENILAFGMLGVLVRVSDKVARLNNLLGSGRTPANEALSDTYADLVGYAAIAHMLSNETFTLELEDAG